MPIGTTDVPPWCKLTRPIDMPYWECTAWNIMDKNGRPCFKPTWSRLVALDLNNGALLWDVPMGRSPGSPAEYGSK